MPKSKKKGKAKKLVTLRQVSKCEERNLKDNGLYKSILDNFWKACVKAIVIAPPQKEA